MSAIVYSQTKNVIYLRNSRNVQVLEKFSLPAFHKLRTD